MIPKISVIIPAYNAEKFISKAIESIVNQQAADSVEVLVIDDASKDSTAAVVAELAIEYPQVKLLSNERCKGPSGARNTGIINATGEFIAFLDADDLWLENHLQEGIAVLTANPTIDVLLFNFDIIDFESRKVLGNWFDERSFSRTLTTEQLPGDVYQIKDDMFCALINESFMHLQAMFVRSATLQKQLFNEQVMRAEDRDFAIRLAIEKHAVFAFKNTITGIYYRHASSLTSQSTENSLATVKDHIFLFESYIHNYQLNTIQKKDAKKTLLQRHISAVYFYRVMNDLESAISVLKSSFRYGFHYNQLLEALKIFTLKVRSAFNLIK